MFAWSIALLAGLAGSGLETVDAGHDQPRIRIPGIGEIRIPLPGRGRARPETPAAQPRQARNGRGNQTGTNDPQRRADGSMSCNTSIDVPGVAHIRIVSARFTDRPPLTGIQGAVSGGIRRWWAVDYEVTPSGPHPFTFSNSFMGSSATDSNGARWGSIDMERNTRRGEHPGGTPIRRTAMFISYDAGENPATLAPTLATSIRYARPSREPVGQMRGNFSFGAIPGNCSDEGAGAVPPRTSIAQAGTAPAGLIRPRQVQREGISLINGRAGSVREAVQAGFIWSYGEGVHPDFEQGLAWYQEANRRQAAQRDFTMQNEIALMLRNYENRDALALANLGRSAMIRNSWQEATFFLGRSAELGFPQAMAALAFAYGEGRDNPRMQVYWCRKAFVAARQSRQNHDLDAVNHFCPLAAFQDMMTPAERRANPASIARARAQMAAITREHDERVAMARRIWDEVMADGGDQRFEADMEIDRAYSRGSAPRPAPPSTSGLYGNCHGGAFYGC